MIKTMFYLLQFMAPKKNTKKKNKQIVMTIILTKKRVKGFAQNSQRRHSRRNTVDAVYWAACGTAQL